MCSPKHEPYIRSCSGFCPCDSQEKGFTRREFIAATGIASTAGLALPTLVATTFADSAKTDRQQPVFRQLKVQPVFNCEIYQRKPTTSWRVTGAIQDERELQEEEVRIRRDLAEMVALANFPLELRPLVTVRSVDQATAVAKGDFDVLVIYAARRNLPVLQALAANDKWNLMFVRHQSGPLYYMYIGAHTHFLRKRRDDFGQPNMDAHDIVVDDHGELLWRKIPGKCTPLKNHRDLKLNRQATFITVAVSSPRSASASAFSFFHSLGRSSSILSAGWILTLLRTSLKYLNGSISFSLQLATRL